MSQARPPPLPPPLPPPAADLHDDAGGWRCPEAVEAGRSRSQWEIGGRWTGLEGRQGHIYYSGGGLDLGYPGISLPPPLPPSLPPTSWETSLVSWSTRRWIICQRGRAANKAAWYDTQQQYSTVKWADQPLRPGETKTRQSLPPPRPVLMSRSNSVEHAINQNIITGPIMTRNMQ